MNHSVFSYTPRLREVLASVAMLLTIAVSFAGPVLAHGGEDHGDEKQTTVTATGPRVEAHSEVFELVGLPSAMNGGSLVVYLQDFWTNAPIETASLELSAGDETQSGVPKNGTFVFNAPWVLTPGHYDLTFSITAGDRSDLLIGRLDIPNPPAPEPAHDTIWDHLWPSTWKVEQIPIWVPFSLLVLAGALTLTAARLPNPLRGAILTASAILGLSSVAVAATVWATSKDKHAEADVAAVMLDLPEVSKRLEDGAVFVPKSAQRLFGLATTQAAQAEAIPRTVRLIGQVIPDPNRSGLVQALLAGRIEPPVGGFPAIGSAVKKGDVLGYLVPRVEVVDQSDIRQTQGDLDRQIELAEAKLQRLERLKAGVVPEAQVTDARIELDALRRRRATIKPVLAEKETLIASADGVLAQVNVAAGQVVEAQAILFQIVDPQNLWVEALAFDTAMAARIEKSGKTAIATTADGRKGTLEFVGRALALRQQAAPLRFKVIAGEASLSVGEPVTVEAPIDEVQSSIPVPRTSVVRAPNGQSIVFAHPEAERFEPRVVQISPIDAERVGITAGLNPGGRIVVRGAELINQVR